MVAGGVVAWSSYESDVNGCVSGTGSVWAMDFETCQDAITGEARPRVHVVGPGIPTTPVLHRQSETLLVQSAAGPAADQVAADAVNTRGGGQPWVKSLYWRVDSN